MPFASPTLSLNNDESLCAKRWKLQYFLSNHHAYLPNNLSDSDVDSMDISMHFSEPASAVLLEQQKYRKTFKVAQNLCQQLSGFDEGMKVLLSVASLWGEGKKVFVREVTGMYHSTLCFVTYRANYVRSLLFYRQ